MFYMHVPEYSEFLVSYQINEAISVVNVLLDIPRPPEVPTVYQCFCLDKHAKKKVI